MPLAVTAYGHARMTQDVDLLLTRDGLRRFRERWLGKGSSKGMRDVENNVKIDIVLAGDYPGDGKPKPVVFPDPSERRHRPWRNGDDHPPQAHRAEACERYDGARSPS